MKHKKIFKIALILFILIITVFITNNIAFADNFDFSGFDNKTGDTALTGNVRTVVGSILSVIRIVGTGVAIIILAVIAMKYMLASPGDRADFKKGAIQYVVGAVIVFSASNIIAFLIDVIEDLV